MSLNIGICDNVPSIKIETLAKFFNKSFKDISWFDYSHYGVIGNENSL